MTKSKRGGIKSQLWSIKIVQMLFEIAADVFVSHYMPTKLMNVEIRTGR